MIKITSFGSGSAGNGYLIDDGHSQILIECGIKLELVKRKMKFDLSRGAGICISHEHGDHSKEIKKVLDSTSIDIFASKETLSALNVPIYRANALEEGKTKQIGSWKVSAFNLNHTNSDGSECPCFGYVFENSSKERLLFITDTYYVKYKFKGITHMMIEANYSLDIIRKKVEENEVAQYLKNRILTSHFEFGNAKEFIKTNMSDQLQEVWLLHLSDSNSNEEVFKREVQELTGIPVYIA